MCYTLGVERPLDQPTKQKKPKKQEGEGRENLKRGISQQREWGHLYKNRG